MNRTRPLGRVSTAPAPRTSLTAQTGRAVDTAMHGADRAVQDAIAATRALTGRPDVASLYGDLERLARDIAEIRATARWLAQGGASK